MGSSISVDRFVSHFTNRLDSKGRVSIPASFRAVLARDGFEGLYVHPSLDREALDCGGTALLQEIEALIEKQPLFSDERDMFSTALMGTSEVLKVDPEGRIVLTDGLKSFAGITDQVVFVGLGSKFQIWEPGRFQAHLSEARERVRQMKKSLGSQSLGASPPVQRGARE